MSTSHRGRNRVLACAAALLPLLSGCGGGGTSAADTIVIGSKNFTENEILSQMMADLLKADTKLNVKTKLDMGGTLVAWNALKSGQIAIYPDYTGTGYMEILKQPKPGTEQGMYNYDQQQYQKKFKIKWLQTFGFNDTYAIAVTQALAQKNNLTTVSSLVPVAPTLTAGIDPECQNRPDCLPGLEKTYNLKFKSVKTMDHSLVEEAMAKGDIQATDAYTTDGGLVKYKLTTLVDDKNFFPAYFAAPIVRMDVLKKHPEIETTLAKLAGKIDDKTMLQLNYQVDISKNTVQKVAHDFLVQKGLLKA